MSKLLIPEPPLQVLPTLVKLLLGDVISAMILQQIHYLTSNPKLGKQYQGRRWWRDSHDGWLETFSWLPKRSLERKMTKLKRLGLVLTTSALNYASTDRTLWYTVDENALEELLKGAYRQIGGMETANLAVSVSKTPLTETPKDKAPENGALPTPFKGVEPIKEKAPEDLPETEYVDDPFDEPITVKGRPNWSIPKTSEEERFLAASRNRKYWHKEEKAIATSIRLIIKGLTPVSSLTPERFMENAEFIYPIEWWDKVIEWGEVAKKKVISPKGLHSFLTDTERKKDNVMIWLEQDEKNPQYTIIFDEKDGGAWV